MSTVPKRKRFLKRLLLAIGVTVAFVFACEGALRLCGYADNAAMYYDPDVGLRLYPNQSREALYEGRVIGTVTTNARGFRGPPFEVEKAPAVRRILCLGDSFTLGWGLDDHETWPHHLQVFLHEHAGADRFEVINLGQPDFNTLNELRLYRRFGRSLSPDEVVVGYVLNDVQPETLGPVNMDSWLEAQVGSSAIMRALRMHFFPKFGVYQYAHNAENTRRREEYVAHVLKILEDPDDEMSRSYWDVSM